MNPLQPLHFANFWAAQTDQYRVLGWIVLLPLLGALLNGLFGKRFGRDFVYAAGVATVGASFLLSLLAFAALLGAEHHAAAQLAGDAAAGAGEEHARPLVQISYTVWDWFRAPTGAGQSAMIKIRYVLDPLSAVMLLVVTGVGTLIHVYSTGYMAHDDGYARYFSFLNLFMFSMLNLILADSIPLLFVGWEGVGLCSYLLIGFWFTNSQYASAGRKAFVVNRIGDVGVILGMTILAWKAGAYDIGGLRDVFAMDHSPAVQSLGERVQLGELLGRMFSFGSERVFEFINYKLIPQFTWGGLATLLLFIGCTGKSAQLPLYVWLPDAMAGPTPVSALIHAATMVTAGVYLLCRLSFVYVSFPSVMAVIAVIGAVTALLAATIALAQDELKKVLAYSTVSQLGFMFVACGVGAFGAGLFHVYTHAMFKACLFLGAGAVMHACRDKQKLSELGGLKKFLPYTYATFAIATLAIIGTPGLSGFFSKDEILFRALVSPSKVGRFVFVTSLLAATLTAFYMCRLLFLTFWGEFKGWSLEPAAAGAAPHGGNAHGSGDAHGDDHGHGHGNAWDPPKENAWNITGVLVALAGLSVVAGYIGLPYLFTHHESVIAHWLAPAVSEWPVDHATLGSKEALAMLLGVAAFGIGSGGAYWAYVVRGGEPVKQLVAAGGMRGLYRLVRDKWRVDELYDLVFVRPLRLGSDLAANLFDRWIVDGIVNLVGIIPRALGAVLRKTQTGSIHVYGTAMALGVLIMVGWAVRGPSATIGYRVISGTRVALEAHGGPGYTYEWDLDGDGAFDSTVADQRQEANCTPVEAPGGRRVCRVGLQVRNAFGLSRTVTRTIELAETAPQAPQEGSR